MSLDNKCYPLLCENCLSILYIQICEYRMNFVCFRCYSCGYRQMLSIDNYLKKIKNFNENIDPLNYVHFLSCSIHSREKIQFYCSKCKVHLCQQCKINHEKAHPLIEVGDSSFIDKIEQVIQTKEEYLLQCEFFLIKWNLYGFLQYKWHFHI